MKPLKNLGLDYAPTRQTLDAEQRSNIFDEYRVTINIPNDSFFYENAILHLKTSNPTAGKFLKNIQATLDKHNLLPNSTLIDVFDALETAMKNANLGYDNPSVHDEAFSKILHVLSDVWKNQYIKQLTEPFAVPSTQSLLERLNTWKRADQGFTLILGPFAIFQGHDDAEKEKMLGIIKRIVIDQTILDKIKLLEGSKRELLINVSETRTEATKLSKAIEVEAYSDRETCCPTFFKMVRNYFF